MVEAQEERDTHTHTQLKYIIFQQFDCQGYITDPEVKWRVDTSRHTQYNYIEDARVRRVGNRIHLRQ